MILYPAIDIRGGKCVRLRQGDFAQETVFSDDPVEMARRWIDQGASWLHLVDLDGAKAGKPINGATIRRIVETGGIASQLGGGLRTEEDITMALALGVKRVIIGTRAAQSPDWFETVCRRWPGRIGLGIDAREGSVALHGWVEMSECSALDLARKCANWPLAAIVYTDIARDGMMAGANIEAMAQMAAAVNVPIIASGGVTTLDDVKSLAQRGLAGCIIGRALYEGTIDFKQALRIANDKMTPGAGNGQVQD